MSNDSSGNFALGLLLGVAVGVGIGLLYAPQTGSATRSMLKEKAVELSERAEEFAENVREGAASAKRNLESRLPHGET
ncbi:YtxH domain-containing protein [Dehalogenimonas etheniformans]|uniref:YtxH domain-containing protein n=1 Tax=Dehalogenimonas etheniformans TaxID=1536648 RepID=A0A2P5P9L5_9CHLR|nr:YtxH domain-containing protein [Dehalogenimonas etheniformans]PPD59003.1 YtxH domain-containing protein [Dehalogenimonas etheniformans]QNT76230.1 YtxH domain-containing protein [Dehalogenimonas etheniformans]